jgi:hypothetical protein
VCTGEEKNDPWSWLTYFVELLAKAYDRFEARAASDRSTGTKQDRVRDYVLNHAPSVFRIGVAAVEELTWTGETAMRAAACPVARSAPLTLRAS